MFSTEGLSILSLASEVSTPATFAEPKGERTSQRSNVPLFFLGLPAHVERHRHRARVLNWMVGFNITQDTNRIRRPRETPMLLRETACLRSDHGPTPRRDGLDPLVNR